LVKHLLCFLRWFLSDTNHKNDFWKNVTLKVLHSCYFWHVFLPPFANRSFKMKNISELKEVWWNTNFRIHFSYKYFILLKLWVYFEKPSFFLHLPIYIYLYCRISQFAGFIFYLTLFLLFYIIPQLFKNINLYFFIIIND
jgi:hypothetical protein